METLKRPIAILFVNLMAVMLFTTACQPSATASPTEQPSATATPPSESLWWQKGIFYEIYPRSYQDSDGNGVGDLGGIIQRLDYIKSLNVDAIWLTPFYPSPMHDWGYDISNYTDVDPLFGTLADFDRLLTEAHTRGIKVIIDFVPDYPRISIPGL